MKLTNMLLFFALIVMICGAPVVAQRTTAPSPEARSPEVVLREFYTWYIHADFHDIDPFKGKGRVTFKKYVTARFIREIDKNEKLVAESGPGRPSMQIIFCKHKTLRPIRIPM